MAMEPQFNPYSLHTKSYASSMKTGEAFQPSPLTQDTGLTAKPSTITSPPQDVQVTLSDEAKSLAADVSEHDTPPLKSFAYGALGMDHPKEIKESHDDAYTAGQILSALGTIGAVLAVVV